ncbi:TIGR03503 family protein [Aliivibrio fischeri]|uniref:TIGR03503 family protein n=1 Tax=Aliivibrio fischeri TaxID=668 RepID=UPI0007C5205C|nr:TIGR03503 family protein [Aliivibrio fischeri]MCE7566559.1 TIGR03503 family protein [Aliivibrio fischeri]MUJ38850.1 TIGR03503 family protein [Aliivibrio fischeri]TDM55027.1 TIGR03503 family protein [Aliivibrio fischeri]
MWRLLIIALFVPMVSWAKSTEMSWLDNRFRVDPTIKQVSFLVYREKASQAVTLVRPDGTKYYAWEHPKNVAWYEENGMDIISIENPMPGPWQAIGKITPENKVKILSNLTLSVDTLPKKLYQSETLKFTARLEQDGKPLVLRDFLNRIKLNVTFTPYLANEKELVKEARPLPQVLGTFEDDGEGLDEVAGDGVFTVNLPVNIKPGKYWVRIQSRNGVFLRTVEQDVLVYPAPIRASFTQARNENRKHTMTIDTEAGAIKAGSLAAHIEQVDPKERVTITQAQSEKDETKLYFDLPNSYLPGKNSWFGWVYATDMATDRPLQFNLGTHNYGVTEPIDLKAAHEARLKAAAEKKKLEEQQRIIEERAEARKWFWIYVVAGNLLIIVLIFAGILAWKKIKVTKAVKDAAPKAEKLSMPPPPKV